MTRHHDCLFPVPCCPDPPSLRIENTGDMVDAMHAVDDAMDRMSREARIADARRSAFTGFGQASLARHPAKSRRKVWFNYRPDGNGLLFGEQFEPPIAFSRGGD